MDFNHFFKCKAGRDNEVGVVSTLGDFWPLKRIAHYLCRKILLVVRFLGEWYI
jgi:hypothetical protein